MRPNCTTLKIVAGGNPAGVGPTHTFFFAHFYFLFFKPGNNENNAPPRKFSLGDNSCYGWNSESEFIGLHGGNIQVNKTAATTTTNIREPRRVAVHFLKSLFLMVDKTIAVIVQDTYSKGVQTCQIISYQSPRWFKYVTYEKLTATVTTMSTAGFA